MDKVGTIVDPQSGITVSSNGSAVGNGFMQVLASVQREQRARDQYCTEWLRANYNIRAEHPDDGWVDRVHNSVHFCYPRLFLQPQVGDLVAFGFSSLRDDRAGTYRIVRVTGTRDNRFSLEERPWHYDFEVVHAEVVVPLPEK